MEKNFSELMKAEGIEKYKIVKIDCRKKSYSLVYGDEKWEDETTATYLVRFLWEGQIKEISFLSETLNITKQLIKYLKKMPGIDDVNDDFQLESTSFVYCEETGQEFEKRISEFCARCCDMNIMVEEKKYKCTWLSHNKCFMQGFDRYKVLALNLNTNYLLNHSFDDENGWKEIYGCLVKENRNELKRCERDEKRLYKISVLAMSKIIKEIARLFFASSICNGESFFQCTDIGKKKFSDYVDLYSLPTCNTLFDAEGNQIRKKYLIRKGVIENFLSNSYYATKILNIDPGNAGLIDKEQIEFQLLKFVTIVKKISTDTFPLLLDFESLNIRNDRIHGVAICKGEERFKKEFSISVQYFFDNIVYLNEEFRLMEKCLTTNAILEL